MAFSGTVSTTTFQTYKLIESAVRRCKLPAEVVTAEYIEIAKNNLFLLLADLANQGTPLWAIQKSIYPLYEGVGSIITYSGTVDILNSTLRQLQEVTGTNTDVAASRTIDFTDDTQVSTVGIKWSATSVNVAFQRSDDGSTWTTIQTEAPDASSGEWTWYDMDSVVAARYFRVLAVTGTLSFTTIFTGNTPMEIPLARLNRDDYTSLPNKVFQNERPLQYWLDRQALSPVMNLWPVPNDAAETSQIIVWAHRYIMDVGTLTQEIEAPQRWYQAIVSLLAARLASEITEVSADLIPILDGKADRDLYTAQQEERDNSPFMITPAIGCYTR